MSHMKRAYKHKPRSYKHAAQKSENKLTAFFTPKNIKIFSLAAVCIVGLGLFLNLFLSGQVQIFNDFQSDPSEDDQVTEVINSQVLPVQTETVPSETTTSTTITETTTSSEISSTATTTTTTTPISNYRPPLYINENSAPENVVYSSNGFSIDASNADQGYIGVKQSDSDENVKVKVVKDDETYYYDLNSQNSYEFLPLQMGSGTYQVSFLEHSSGTRYTSAFSESVSVSLSPELIPFLYPNQYVDYNSDSYCVTKSREICKNSQSELESLQLIYNYLLKNLSFDYSRLSNLSSDYIPNIDATLRTGSATCFDYAATLTAMLRTQAIPAKLIIGTAEPNGVAHAWVKVYMQDSGYLTPNLYISKGWNIVDVTFASSGENGIEAYISNPSNYNGQRVY